MKNLFLTGLALGCLVMCESSAHGCFCVTPDVPEAFKQAKAVFLGQVVDIVEPKTVDVMAPLPGRFSTIKFKIQKSWKGVPFGRREFSVLSAQGGYGCFAFPVSKGQLYLIYADPASNAGNWSLITVCGRSTIVRFGFSPLDSGVSNPFEDMKQLDAINKRAFNKTRHRRRA